jgi:hypothetical protein
MNAKSQHSKVKNIVKYECIFFYQVLITVSNILRQNMYPTQYLFRVVKYSMNSCKTSGISTALICDKERLDQDNRGPQTMVNKNRINK